MTTEWRSFCAKKRHFRRHESESAEIVFLINSTKSAISADNGITIFAELIFGSALASPPLDAG